MSKCAAKSKTRNKTTFTNKKVKQKRKKVVEIEEIRAELRGAMGGRRHTIIDDNEEEEEGDEDMYMYLIRVTVG